MAEDGAMYHNGGRCHYYQGPGGRWHFVTLIAISFYRVKHFFTTVCAPAPKDSPKNNFAELTLRFGSDLVVTIE